MADTIKIGGELESMATGNKVADVANIKDKTQNDKSQAEINAEAAAAIEAETQRATEAENNRYTKEETYSKGELNNLITTPNQKYVTVTSYASLPVTGEADTVYRVSNYDGSQSQVDATKYSEYAWNGSAYVFLSVKTQIGEVFDISEYHSGAVYADLSDALGTNGANVPATIRRGGMSVKYKQITTPASYSVDKTEGLDEQPTGTELLSDPGIDDGTYNASQLSAFATLPISTGAGNAVTYWMAVAGDSTTYTKWVVTLIHTDDNKYVQYRLMSDSFNTTVSNWQGVDDEPMAESGNLVTSGGVNRYLLNNYLIGADATYKATKIYGLIKGHTYRIYISKPIYKYETSSGANVQFQILINDLNNTTIATVEKFIVNDGKTPKDHYTFVIPENYEYVLIGGRFKNGHNVHFSIIDLSYTDEKISELNDSLGSINTNIEQLSNSTDVNTNLINNYCVSKVKADLTLAVGTIYKGKNQSDTSCLRSNNYIAATGAITCYHAEDIYIRISEYNENKEYIRQSSYSKFEEKVLHDNTRFVRISASYGERGYSSENPITVNDFQDGDFGFYYYKSNSAEESPFDISKYNAEGNVLASYSSLTEALSDVPLDKQRGGMLISFVLKTNIGTEEEPEYTYEYVIYFNKKNVWSVSDTDWVGITDEILDDSNHVITSGSVKKALKELTQLKYKEFYGFFTRTVTQGSSASATNTKKNVKILVDSIFHIHVDITNNCLKYLYDIVLWYDDGTTFHTGIITAARFPDIELVAEKDITAIGLNWTTAYAINDGVLTWNVEVENKINEMAKTVDELANESKNSVTVYNLNKDIHTALISAKNQKYNYPTNPNDAMCAFLVMTDIHTDWVRFERGIKYADDEALIDSVLVLGDVGNDPGDLRSYNYENATIGCRVPVLTIPGNHEIASGGSHVPFTDQEFINKFYTENLVLKNGDIHPEGKVWWYKDITHSYWVRESGSNVEESKTIRVIGLNQADYCEALNKNVWYFTQAQIDWLVDVLDDTPSDYYVLILTHSTIEDESRLTEVNCKFNCNYKRLQYTNLSNSRFITDIVRAWINGTSIEETSGNTHDDVVLSVNHTFTIAHTGKFIGFLSGHSHRDYVSRISGEEPIYQFNLHCTTAAKGQQNGDIGRESDGKSQDCLTIFIYDWFAHRVKLIRVGADVTTEMTKRDFDVINLV